MISFICCFCTFFQTVSGLQCCSHNAASPWAI